MPPATPMKSELKLKFSLKNNILYFRVLSMPEEWRGKGMIYNSDKYKTRISSYSNPGIDISNGTNLFLRGSNPGLDSIVFQTYVLASDNAQLKVLNIIDALSEFLGRNPQLSGFLSDDLIMTWKPTVKKKHPLTNIFS